ncbi:hypothetical protein AM500_21415 [Bacillus sp. FJAT-18017]|uniref:HK97 family phage prohead protease n=1 Tax=Bacillus sp. FJAT-18017 TaxID=1705566 RepID=UPI0006AE7DCE|nr:HK97 family phage prohead protease [Bacillus sp. FJAT-18017]ALC92066.1 hypothetical protein AM500_21415 [Bacillus sp. FJAT-18017]
MNEKEKRSLTNIEVRAEPEGEKKRIVGYAVKWGQRSVPIWGMFAEQFERGAFAESINDDIYAAWNHNPSEILGRNTAGTLKLQEDEVGLRYEITPPSWADKYVESIERGDVRGSSFIFRAEVDEWDETEEMAVRTVKKAKLFEVSPVTTPAYPTSETGIRSAEAVFNEFKQKKVNTDNSFEKELELMEMF